MNSGPGSVDMSADPYAGVVLEVHLEGRLVRSLAHDGEAVLIGRHRACELQLEAPVISRRHARLHRDGALVVEDLDSRNGTRVNGRTVHRARVGPGDIIGVGPYRLHLRAATPDEGPALGLMGAGATEHRHAGSTGPDSAPRRRPVIRVLSGAQSGSELVLERPFVALGELGEHVAVVTRRRGLYWVRGVTGHGPQLIHAGEPMTTTARELIDGDRLVVGTQEMIYLEGEGPA